MASRVVQKLGHSKSEAGARYRLADTIADAGSLQKGIPHYSSRKHRGPGQVLHQNSIEQALDSRTRRLLG